MAFCNYESTEAAVFQLMIDDIIRPRVDHKEAIICEHLHQGSQNACDSISTWLTEQPRVIVALCRNAVIADLFLQDIVDAAMGKDQYLHKRFVNSDASCVELMRSYDDMGGVSSFIRVLPYHIPYKHRGMQFDMICAYDLPPHIASLWTNAKAQKFSVVKE